MLFPDGEINYGRGKTKANYSVTDNNTLAAVVKCLRRERGTYPVILSRIK